MAQDTVLNSPVLRAKDSVIRVIYWAILGFAIVFCLLPPVMIVGMSFFNDVFSSFPPKQFSLDPYRDLFSEGAWLDAVKFTILLAIPTAIFTILVVVPATLALERAKVAGKPIIQFVVLLPLLMPSTGFAVGIYILYLRLGWTDSFVPLMFVQAVVGLPIVFIIVRTALQRIPASLEYAAMSLGASKGRAIWDVTLPLLRPALVAGALFSIIHVFDDALYVTFLGGTETTTVSKAIFDAIEFQLRPVIAALSATFTVFTTGLTLVALGFRGGAARRKR